MSDQLSMISNLYQNFDQKHQNAREYFARPLNLAQKILTAHMKKLEDEDGQKIILGQSYAHFFPDRVSMQDATAQMALLQFISAKKKSVAVPSTIHCDHLVMARVGAEKDLNNAKVTNQEVYDFLRTAAAKYGIGFYEPGSGIIHQVVLENYAFPGGMMVGTDSHTPNGGGLGMIAIGVGGADAVDVMVAGQLLLKWPKVIGVKLLGELTGWSSPKDVILKLMSILKVTGGTGSIVEFFGDGAKSISATGKATITNMGAEHGATCSIFPYDSTMRDYLRASKREQIADLADKYALSLRADEEVYKNPQKYYDQVIEIDLAKLEPQIVGPHSPDLCRSVKDLKGEIEKNGYLNELKAALVGSCTNSSFEDLTRASSIAQEAASLGLKAKVPFYITPGSETVFQTAEKAELLKPLKDIGGIILANACGPCIGQWQRDDISLGEKNTIVSSYNRNFPGRNDGNRQTLSFLTSPEIVVGMALSGKLDFDPVNDELLDTNGKKIKLSAPKGKTLPKEGLTMSTKGYVPPPKNGDNIEIAIKPGSDRLALLEPFEPWNGQDFSELVVLLKAKGKCTTDHISQAGKWLKYRGNLDKIADNTYIGAVNAFTSEPGTGIKYGSKNEILSLPDLARYYKNHKQSFIVIGDENFGEGSSREHAAMQPRYLGCKAILVKSFARIHETNLKKQGILPLTFINSNDYDLIKADDLISVVDLKSLAPNKPIKIIITHKNGDKDEISCQHTMSQAQITWFKEGSAINALAKL